MKTILKILNYAAPYKGNFINSLENLEAKLNDRTYRIVYLFPNTAKNLYWIAQMISMKKKIYFMDTSFYSKKIRLKNIFFLLKVIRMEKIDIIHTHFIDYNYSLFLTKKLFFLKLRIIGQFHCQYHPTKNIIGDIKRFVTRNTFDLLIGVGESVAVGIKTENIPESKVVYVRNGIDFNRLDNFQPYSIRQNKNQKVVLMFGWLFHIKGVDTAIITIRKLNDCGYNIILAISLSGGLEQIKTLIKKEIGAIPDWLMFLEARDDVATYYNAADVFLSASREEGLNYSVIEASYCNPLVVASDIPGNPQDIPGLFTHGAGNVNQLMENLQNVFSLSESIKENIKKKQRDYVIKHYNLDTWSSEIMKYYL